MAVGRAKGPKAFEKKFGIEEDEAKTRKTRFHLI
jgi:hypothetical protein